MTDAQKRLCEAWHLVGQVLNWLADELPELRAELGGVELSVKVALDETDIARGASADLRGYYWGTARLPAEDGGDGTGFGCPDMLERMPGEGGAAAIVLFAQNIEPLTRDTVALVLLHELGHLCGFDEWELTEGLGLG